ncbi:thioesterase family protein [Parvibaculum sp.]|uniref:thioesterase family protein n=1 Tax=Parvibaculum sp. TaxID=2024848 RepID=UPI001B243C5B|nr:thioesterase family protein [Parvibaculum sp.]MBO6635004.1 acyl-ACP thioesterase [Parvibaculum sp.]MBO6678141.1 acyl-ACP thioesterase [Parvibaculum sp.]MBO6683711.1 acyl-ACP thioesterase [Parvibaculum sp.]MBO6904751.1 acyl-ACP thioesterase [Parvibaculum sp.]
MSEMIEVARSSVQTWECDQMGHMNVQFYVEKAGAGLAALSLALGLGPRVSRGEGARLFVRDHHVRFLREQRPGAPFFIRAGVLEVRDFGLRVYEEMVNTVSGEPAASFIAEVEWLDEETREMKPLPAKAKAAAKELVVELPVHGSPRGLEIYEPRPAPKLKEADAMGMVRTWQGEIETPQCDGQGFLTIRHFMGIVSDGIPNLLAQTSGADRSRTPTVGGAALEYRFVYRRHPRVGDVLTLRSGLKQVGPKTYTWCHWLFDLETGEAIATAEAVAIALDLTTRKAIPIPEEMRANLESLVIEGLGV